MQEVEFHLLFKTLNSIKFEIRLNQIQRIDLLAVA